MFLQSVQSHLLCCWELAFPVQWCSSFNWGSIYFLVLSRSLQFSLSNLATSKLTHSSRWAYHDKSVFSPSHLKRKIILIKLGVSEASQMSGFNLPVSFDEYGFFYLSQNTKKNSTEKVFFFLNLDIIIIIHVNFSTDH